MIERNDNLQLFADAAFVAFDQFAQTTKARVAVLQIFAALELACPQRRGMGMRLPACSHLAAALSIETPHKSLQRLIARFKAIEPRLEWRRRTNEATASKNFADGHANAMIIGPGGLEERSDIWLGVTLMAPHVRYPDHNHAPEEVYLVLSPGEFRQGDGGWFSPGVGGSFYNVPEIKHAMRSTDAPLLAFWALKQDDQ
ncbi:dimethylsulfoniopropionate lyase [Phyllobacterium endophyticum]|uniref:Transcriptional regulator n=1 Tax=Phyllobacterium endophyticum TaxID=1149773 RepID=A0A2P7AQX3_9HYPH|nr:dimethylsulfoniopropionate lyase [Phyllobacterium endophyticum]MBB3236965.1 uncharacterized protein involved in type VI secretion and phage assembly [Phyllobacterium endophyticum]PSH56543.1 transcriptional regulator [Phyllobacterium endophyticum]TYR44458.1 transcriptional regulator [Phyllobacterium endophyticum]